MIPLYARSILLLFLLALASACASRPSGPQTGDVPRRSSATQLSRDDLRNVSVMDAYEAIRTLRPIWLQRRGQLSLTRDADVAVYLDDLYLGTPQALRSIPVSTVTSMQYLDGPSATQRWGTNHVHGAILVRTGDRSR